MLNRQEEERRRREEEMLRKREMEEQMRRQREENYRMGGFMDVSWISRNLIYYCRQKSDVNINLVFCLCRLLQREREMRMNAGGAMGLGGKCLFSFKLFDWLCMKLAWWLSRANTLNGSHLAGFTRLVVEVFTNILAGLPRQCSFSIIIRISFFFFFLLFLFKFGS